MLRGTDADSIRQALGVDAPDQLDGDIDVAICRTWYDRRRKIVSLHHSHRIAAPAKSDLDMGL